MVVDRSEYLHLWDLARFTQCDFPHRSAAPFDYLIYGGLPLSTGHRVALHPDNKPAI